MARNASRILAHAAYLACAALLVALVPVPAPGAVQGAAVPVIALGAFGIWRYSWAGLNMLRAAIYRLMVWPRRKARAEARFAGLGIAAHAWFMVTTYMVATKDTIACYRALFAAAAAARDGATIVASVVDGADERLIRALFAASPHDLGRVSLVIDRIRSSGKRDAMARALRLIARQNPTRHDIVVFVDGDTCVPADIVARSAPMFTDHGVGALTTDEGVLIGRANLYRDWFILRFNQRQVMMCSMGLSRHVLTLTGRMSVFRADLATDPGFINAIWSDHLDHWRHGRIEFLTGDDKSTWFWLLKNGYRMVYLPDVRSWSMESQPCDGFIDSARTLMARWYGNMLRTNGRALRLPPRLIGGFTWWSILDQRASIFTTLTGPLSALLAAFAAGWQVLPLYAAWVLVTRYIYCVILALFRGEWFPVTHPPLLYFSQVAGALVKCHAMFRLDRQKWTRQGSAGAGHIGLSRRIAGLESGLHHAVALAWLVLGVLLLGQI